VAVFLLFAQPTPFSFSAGLILLVLGETLRFWSVAYAGRETREATIVAPRLVTCGPFAYVRNPIYLGNMIMYSGVTIIANLWLPLLLLFVWLYFGVQYALIVAAEEQALSETFGSDYQHYRNNVPAWLPTRGRYHGKATPFLPAAALKSEKSTLLSIVAMLAVLYLRMTL
jgi:protein-S-isoprenylcysteine O-methyltransferase Ste14